MMDFFAIPLVVFIIAYSVYNLFDLFVRKRERIMLIEKISELSQINGVLPDVSSLFSKRLLMPSFTALRIGAVLLGIGAGLLIGGLVVTGFNQLDLPNDFRYQRMVEGMIGASVLLCAGIALLIVYFIERKEACKAKKEV